MGLVSNIMPQFKSRQLPTFQQHVATWHNCQACALHTTRKQVVFARGDIPCDVLFIGEAPGESENVIGRPFVGPAGRMIDDIIRLSMPLLCEVCRCPQFMTSSGEVCKNGHGGANGIIPRVCLTNLIACIPRDMEKGGKTDKPSPESIVACLPRLQQFVDMARPRLVVRVGDVAASWVQPGIKHSVKLPPNIPLVDIVHPAFILRANIARREILKDQCVVTIQDAMGSLL